LFLVILNGIHIIDNTVNNKPTAISLIQVIKEIGFTVLVINHCSDYRLVSVYFFINEFKMDGHTLFKLSQKGNLHVFLQHLIQFCALAAGEFLTKLMNHLAGYVRYISSLLNNCKYLIFNAIIYFLIGSQNLQDFLVALLNSIGRRPAEEHSWDHKGEENKGYQTGVNGGLVNGKPPVIFLLYMFLGRKKSFILETWHCLGYIISGILK